MRNPTFRPANSASVSLTNLFHPAPFFQENLLNINFTRVRRVTALVLASLASAALITGCASNGGTDVAGLSTSYEPVPLAEETVVHFGGSDPTEGMSAVLIADEMGEFAKENIVIDWQWMPGPDLVTSVATGTLDAMYGGMSVGMVNAISGGAEIRLVATNASSSVQDGLWVKSELAAAGPAALKGKTIASPSGAGINGIVPISEYLAEGGLTIDDVNIIMVPQADLGSTFASGQAQAAWMSAPEWAPFATDGSGQRVTGYTLDTPAGGYFFGPNFLTANPEVGQAFMRALVRAERTYLSGDYKSDPEVAAALMKRLDVTDAELRLTESREMGLPSPTAFYQKAQSMWIEIGDLMTATEPLTVEQMTDWSFRDRIVVP